MLSFQPGTALSTESRLLYERETDLCSLMIQPGLAVSLIQGPSTDNIINLNMAAREDTESRKRKSDEDQTPGCKRRRMEKVSAELLGAISSNLVILDQIFRHLDPADLKTVCLVSRLWRLVVEVPRFWTWASVRLTDEEMEEMLRSSRLRLVRRVRLYCRLERNQLTFLQVLARRELELDQLVASQEVVSQAPARVLAKAVVVTREVEITEVSLTQEQVSAIFNNIAAEKELRLVSLHLWCGDGSTVSPSDLVRAVVRLKVVDLDLFTSQGQRVEMMLKQFVEDDQQFSNLLVISNFENIETERLRIIVPIQVKEDQSHGLIVVKQL